MPSLHIDLYGGRGTSEVDYLNGAVVRFGERLGISTPVNKLLNETLLTLTRGDLPLKEYAHQPDKLIEKALPVYNHR
jgi:2-dehydropantoate 2-reductase